MNLKNKYLLFSFVFVSCENKKDFVIKDEKVITCLNNFIVESNHKALNQSKDIVINFYKFNSDTILCFERTKPYRIEDYKGSIKWEDFNLYLYNNFENNYIVMNRISSHIKERNVDLPFRHEYMIKNGKLIDLNNE